MREGKDAEWVVRQLEAKEGALSIYSLPPRPKEDAEDTEEDAGPTKKLIVVIPLDKSPPCPLALSSFSFLLLRPLISRLAFDPDVWLVVLAISSFAFFLTAPLSLFARFFEMLPFNFLLLLIPSSSI